MTLLKDLILADQKVPTRTFVKPYVDRPHILQFSGSLPAQPLPFLSPFSDYGLSPDFLMGEAPTFPTDFVIKTEPSDLDNYCPVLQDTCSIIQIPNGNHQLLPNGNPINLNHLSTNINNNNNPGDATPTENAMSLTELDQLLNPELTFYDELQMSGLVKRELPGRSVSTDDKMEYDSDSAESEGSVVVCSGSFQEVESEIVRQVKNDIRQARSMLELPSDPKRWSPENVQNWILWMLKHYNLGVVENLDNFLMDGREFSTMTEQDFKIRSPLLGAVLYAQLDMWQNVCTLDDPTPTSSPAKSRLPQPNPAFLAPEQRRTFLELSTSTENVPAPSSSDPVSPDPLSPTDSSLDNTSFGSSVSSCGSDDESETSGRQTIHLWQFLKMLLLQPQFYGNCIRWLDRENGIFKIEDSQRVAKLWGKRKNRPAMNYDKLSRSIRQYYKKGIIKKTENSKRLVYRFCHPYSL